LQRYVSGVIGIETDGHHVATGDIDGQIDLGDERQIHFADTRRRRANVQLTRAVPELRAVRIDPTKRHSVCADVELRTLEVHDEMRARMYGGKRRDLQRVEHTEDVELPLLRQVRRVGEESERHLHDPNIDGLHTRVYFSCMASPLRGSRTQMPADGARLTRSDEHAPAASTRPSFGATDLSLLLMALIWGVNYTSVKFGTTVLDPLAFNGVRITLAAVSLLVIAQLATRVFGLEKTGWPSRRDVIALLLLGTLGNGLYQILFVEGIARTRAGDAALLISAAPAFIAIIGRFRGTEHVTAKGVFGIALSIIGMGLVVVGTTSAGPTQRATLLGDSLLLISSVCWSIYTVYSQPYTHRIGGLHLSAVTMVGGMVPMLLVAAPAIAATSWTKLPPLVWGSLTYSGIGALVIAYLFWYNGVRVLGPTRTAMYANVQPVFALAVAWLALGEAITGWQIAGAISIITGLLLTRS